MYIEELLRKMAEIDASDLHLKAGAPPIFRIHGELIKLDGFKPLNLDEPRELIYKLLSPEEREKFEKEWELDASYEIKEVGRYRINLYFQRGSVGVAIRRIPYRIMTLEKIGVPETFYELIMRPKGLLLVTGPTGCGKTTTLAAIIDYINTHKACHIITVEDPIEYVHEDKKCLINQRALGVDTASYNDGLKYALREDPDVILVGELRDLETIASAITAAETGHLVLSTLHTRDAPQAIDRLIDVFPPHQQNQIRMQLSVNLLGVLSQELIPLKNEKGRVAAFELMVTTPAVQNLIRNKKTQQIYHALQTGARLGMKLFDFSLAELVVEGKIRYEEGLRRARREEIFKDALSRMKSRTNKKAGVIRL